MKSTLRATTADPALPSRTILRANTPIRAAALLAVAAALATQTVSAQQAEWRYWGADAASTPLLPPRPDRRVELRAAGGRLDLARRQLQPLARRDAAGHAHLRGWHALLGGRQPADRGGDRSRHRRDPMDLPRAHHQAVGGLDAEELRQGRRLRGGGRPAPRSTWSLPPSSCTRWIRRPGGRSPPSARAAPSTSSATSAAGTTIPPRESPSRSATSPTRRLRSWSTAWSWSATPTSRATTSTCRRTCRETSSPTTPGPASTSGPSTSSRRRANSGTTPGRTTPGSGPATCRRGPRSPPTPNWASSML